MSRGPCPIGTLLVTRLCPRAQFCYCDRPAWYWNRLISMCWQVGARKQVCGVSGQRLHVSMQKQTYRFVEEKLRRREQAYPTVAANVARPATTKLKSPAGNIHGCVGYSVLPPLGMGCRYKAVQAPRDNRPLLWCDILLYVGSQR